MRALLVVGLLATNAYAIVGGTPGVEDTVVPLVRGDGLDQELVCSGVIITRFAVLTAAHCLASSDLPDIYIGSDRYTPIAKFVSPAFDPVALTSDIGILVFDPPLPISGGLTTRAVFAGAHVELFGFGRTAPNESATPLLLRTGEAIIDRLDPDATFRSSGPSRTCEGDSGGPAYLDGDLVGLTSSGDVDCAMYSRHTRIDEVKPVIDQLTTRGWPHTRFAGQRCWFSGHCADDQGACVPALDEPRLSFCSPACIDGACADGLACVDDLCRVPSPSPGATGTACDAAADCVDDLCLASGDGNDTVCTRRCFSDLPGFDCPSGERCQIASDGQDACFRAPDDGGCATSRPSSLLVVLVLALGQLLRGRGKP